MKNYYLKTALTFLILSACASCWAALSLTADRTELEANETLQLTVIYGDTAAGEPDFSPIQRDFEIVSNSRQQQSSRMNGTSTSSTSWKMLLLPKRQGQLSIPALSFKGHASNSLKILVRPANSAGNGAVDQPVFTETSIDKNSAYIQEQIILTQRLYTSVQLQDLSLSELEIPDVLVQRIGETQFQKVIHGKNHLVVEIKFAVFPQTAGKLSIPAQRISAFETSRGGQFGGFFSRGKRILRLTEAKTLDIMPRPAHIAPNQWMPSSKLSLRETWSHHSNSLTVGEPIIRTINISAQGLTAAQIQPLPTIEKPKNENNGFKIYPDQPKLEDQQNAQGILGLRSESTAMVPNQEGALTLPAIEIEWWDTLNKRMQTSRLPARSFTVIAADTAPQNNSGDNLAAANNTAPALNSPSVQSETSPVTRWSLTLNALLIAALVALLYLRRTPPRRKTTAPITAISSSKQQLKQIEKLAADNSLGAMRDAILQWGAEAFPEQPPRSLKQLGTIMENDQLLEQFAVLDQQLFKAEIENANRATVNSKTIIKNLQAYMPKQRSADKAPSGLKPLYPDYKS
ncbi:MAG: BatD family protein [Porticoccaceae bacterium]|nr:BatD family protein [Porticoccaceae bacterium]